jgi:hypothetical protein
MLALKPALTLRDGAGFGIGRSLFSAGQQGFFLDFSDRATLFQDRAGTTPVTTTGQLVGYIRDKSGRGNHFTAISDAARGTYTVEGSLFYIAFNGTSTGYSCVSFTPGADKVQMFAGVRKLSDAAAGVIVETSATSTSNNGTIALFAPNGTAVPGYSSRSRGTVLADAVVSTGYASPVTSVLTGIGDIAADTSILRVNGTQVASVATDQGTGNYLAYQAFLGARAGTSLFLNGRIYSLICRFGANLSAATISSVEKWVNERTGAF